MPVRPLPPKPSLAHLKYQARDLLRNLAARDLGAAQRVREFHPKFADATDAEIFDGHFRLSDAQLAIARESGFSSWTRLKRHIEKPTLSDKLDLPHHERIEDAQFRRGVELLDAGDAAGLRLHLKQHPDLVLRRVIFEGGNYFRNPSMLEFVAENPIRHGTLSPNIVEVARIILDAGAEPSAINETLGLVVTGRVVRESHVQLQLIDLLCDYGADPSRALRAALQGGREAVSALVRRGAQVDFTVAAALGDMDDVRRLLPDATPRERHLAFALASQFGEVEVVRLLLDAGEDPNRYNPVGCHSHSTPLHQAAAAGHLEVVRLLVERGARMDLKDILWHGTPAGWAKHEGRKEVERFLLAQDGTNK
ncbi:MAG TPA: ankyrin repeat domain-containing protein [Candidatus Methylomirabilis sp.]|nr:ankyrin repeat domain-containing protein [Candidatus Methylomirabilis sp.]